jgi:hypothetical protein
MAELEEKRAHLATVERELTGLVIRHDLAMSAFKFDEAREVQQQIAVLERERGELVDSLPSPVVPAPETVRRRRLTRRRRRVVRR